MTLSERFILECHFRRCCLRTVDPLHHRMLRGSRDAYPAAIAARSVTGCDSNWCGT